MKTFRVITSNMYNVTHKDMLCY